MQAEECFQLGYITKAHALQGEVQIFLDVDNPEKYQKMESVFVDRDGSLIPFFIESIASLNGQKAIVAFEDVETREQAEQLVSSKLYLPLSFLPDLGEGNYYYHQLIGCTLYDGDLEIGIILDVYENQAQNILSIDHKDKEVLVPLSEHIISNVDIKASKVIAKLPEGLLDIYL